MLKKSASIIIFSLLALQLFGQNQANIWYFGYGGGLNFSSGSPVSISGGQISAYEGCATACDASSGLLLFYTDGIRVWNKNHAQMPNGFGLYGDNYCSASALIVPQPGSSTLYYIFTTTGNAAPMHQLHYSIVDMSLNAGLGDVTTKNTLLLDPSCEKLTGVYHCNGIDTWVISHELNNNSFHAFLVTASGINPAVVSSVGGVHNNGKGYMKAAPNGKKLGLAANATGGGIVELFDFNNFTGVVSNPISLPADICNYAVSFSPDNSKFYVTGFEFCPQEQLFQYDLSSGNAAAIIASKTYIATEHYFGALQNGPDGKMYLALDGQDISVINNPNAAGLACNYTSNSINLIGGSSSHGLPYFIESYFNQLAFGLGNDTTICSASFSINAGPGWAHYLWSNGDTTQTTLVSTTGNYWVTVNNGSCSVSDTIFVQFNSYSVNLGNDTSLCVGDSIVINAGPGNSWQWSTGANTQSITVNTTGTYWVTVNSNNCSGSDTIQVQFNQFSVNLGNDTVVCTGSVLPLNAGAGTSWLWSTGQTTQSINVNSSGTYWVQAFLGGCAASDTVQITIIPISVNVGNDTSICPGDPIVLDAGVAVSYLWSTGDTTQSITINAPGAYWVTINNGMCYATDSINISSLATAVNLGEDVITCDPTPVTLDAGITGVSYLWSTGENTKTIAVSKTGKYWVDVQTGSCIASDTVQVTIDIGGGTVYFPNAFTPNMDRKNNEFKAMGAEITSFHIRIYNRWGELCFESNDINQGWDGSYRGRKVGQDTFVWICDYATPCSDPDMVHKVGHVSVIK